MWLYILECRNGALYTGITQDLEKRFALHQSGKGAKYTRANPPIRIVQRWRIRSGRARAQKLEYAIKQLNRTQKLALINNSKKLYTLVKPKRLA